MSDRSNNKIFKYLRSVKTRRASLRLQNKSKSQDISITGQSSTLHSPLGFFNSIPEELLFFIFNHIPLYDLASLTLTSRAIRDKILTYHYTTQALLILKPCTTELDRAEKDEDIGKNGDVTLYYNHFHNLGIFLKRLTCLFSTRERLRIVGVLLEKLKDTHLVICECFGSNIAYRCYGYMLHAFIAGWENDEKCRAHTAIKGASRVDERLTQALNKGPGTMPWYEKYVRVFYREIFLDKAEDGIELGFWLSQMLSSLPLVFQARMLFILYGPEDEEQELLVWNKMTTCPTFFGVKNEDLEGLAKALSNLHKYNVKEWSKDNMVSVLEELIALPGGWCLENIAKLLTMCGSDICCEFLGSKAVNGRIQELAYIAYYIAQALMEKKANENETKANLEWFVNLIKQVLKYFSCDKQKQIFVATLFDVWQETIIGLNEDIYSGESANDTDLDLEIFTMSVHTLTRVTGMLLLGNVNKL